MVCRYCGEIDFLRRVDQESFNFDAIDESDNKYSCKSPRCTKEDYGQELILDLHHCDVSTFNRESISNYLTELCRLIDMEKAEMYFWDDEGLPPEECQTNPKTCGISAVQFILTSTIVIHTLTKLHKAYINIFSCKAFDKKVAWQFTENWFGSKLCSAIHVRRI
jgi:S-adenosylmethionine/arginine decarboxylase-like enzyme